MYGVIMMCHFIHIQRVHILYIKNSNISSDSLINIQKSFYLTSLQLENVNIDSEYILDFDNFTNLQFIYLSNIPNLSLNFTTLESVDKFFANSDNYICNVKKITVKNGLKQYIELKNINVNIENDIDNIM